MPTKKRPTKKAQAASDDGPVHFQNVVRFLPPDLTAHYADNMLVVHSENEFIISFLQTEYPLAGSREELNQVESLRTKCVARVIIHANRMADYIEALQANHTKYINTYKKAEAEHDS